MAPLKDASALMDPLMGFWRTGARTITSEQGEESASPTRAAARNGKRAAGVNLGARNEGGALSS